MRRFRPGVRRCFWNEQLRVAITLARGHYYQMPLRSIPLKLPPLRKEIAGMGFVWITPQTAAPSFQIAALGAI
jgi:hypothetical protein